MKNIFIVISIVLITMMCGCGGDDDAPLVYPNKHKSLTKTFTCWGSTDCKNGSDNKDYCNAPETTYAPSAEDAVNSIVFSCEVALNLGGSSCENGGYCCKKGSVECEEK